MMISRVLHMWCLLGLIAAQKLLGKSMADHTFLILGAGEAGTGIAELISLKISKEIHLWYGCRSNIRTCCHSESGMLWSRFDISMLQRLKKKKREVFEECKCLFLGGNVEITARIDYVINV